MARLGIPLREPADGQASTVGDIGHVDTDGFLYLTDRKSHMIISGDVNIYPQETENLLSLHPAVADVAVIGVPNPDLGEEVKAVVELVDPEMAGPAIEADPIAYCRSELASIKCPRSGLHPGDAAAPQREAVQACAPGAVLAGAFGETGMT